MNILNLFKKPLYLFNDELIFYQTAVEEFNTIRLKTEDDKEILLPMENNLYILNKKTKVYSITTDTIKDIKPEGLRKYIERVLRNLEKEAIILGESPSSFFPIFYYPGL